MKKDVSKKIVVSVFQICKYAFSNIWKKTNSKKVVPGIFRLVSMLFEIFEKGYEQKNCSSYFQIRKRILAKKLSKAFSDWQVCFLNICKRVWAKKLSEVFSDLWVWFFKYLKKGMSKKILTGKFQICKNGFFKYLKKSMSKKIVPGIFKLLRMLFWIFEKGYDQKNCPWYFWDS